MIDESYKLVGGYTFEIYYDTEDDWYITLVPQLGCMGDGPTPMDALRDAADAAAAIIAAAIEDGRLKMNN